MPREYVDPAYVEMVEEGDILYQDIRVVKADHETKATKVPKEDTVTNKKDA